MAQKDITLPAARKALEDYNDFLIETEHEMKLHLGFLYADVREETRTADKIPIPKGGLVGLVISHFDSVRNLFRENPPAEKLDRLDLYFNGMADYFKGTLLESVNEKRQEANAVLGKLNYSVQLLENSASRYEGGRALVAEYRGLRDEFKTLVSTTLLNEIIKINREAERHAKLMQHFREYVEEIQADPDEILDYARFMMDNSDEKNVAQIVESAIGYHKNTRIKRRFSHNSAIFNLTKHIDTAMGQPIADVVDAAEVTISGMERGRYRPNGTGVIYNAAYLKKRDTADVAGDRN